uniref:Uncharacterized protein n=1 Tax=Macaca fascicularis TaxID=9541 RepID=Q9N026_MACFA|nr:hypothetical protein [Macaca fascicularis]
MGRAWKENENLIPPLKKTKHTGKPGGQDLEREPKRANVTTQAQGGPYLSLPQLCSPPPGGGNWGSRRLGPLSLVGKVSRHCSGTAGTPLFLCVQQG